MATNRDLRRACHRYFLGMVLVTSAATVAGCFALSPELQRESDKLALELSAKQKEVQQAYADIKEGKLDATQGLELVKTLTTEIADINVRINEIAASTGTSKAKVAGIVLFNLVLIALGGKKFLTYKNAVLNVVRTIHAARENKGSVEDVVKALKGQGNKAIVKAAAQMPKLKKKKKS